MHLRAAYARLRRSSNLALSRFGMTADQYVLLRVLAERGKSTQQELVRHCYSDTATIGTMVALLEDKGLVTRARHPHDGRALSVGLTRAGRRLEVEMTNSSASLRSELVSLFTPEEVRTIIGFLDRLAGALRPPKRNTARGASARRRLSKH